MPKKKRASKAESNRDLQLYPPSSTNPLLVPQTVGSNISKRIQYKLAVESFGHDTKPPHIPEEEWGGTCLDAWRKITPEQTIYDNLEKTAKRILEAAKLPTADSIYSIPEGRPLLPEEWKIYPGRRGTLVSLAEAHGFRERIDIEWYAAKILVGHYGLRKCLDRDPKAPYAAAAVAFELGMLVREKDILIEYIKKNAKKGGSKNKRIPAVESFVQKRLQVDPSLKPAALWHMIPDDNRKGLQIGEATLYREDILLMVDMEDPNDDRQLSFASFRRYVTNAKKLIAS
jgi:hypothetical protein